MRPETTMPTDPPPMPGFSPVAVQPQPPAGAAKKLLAPAWHAVVIVLLLLANSFASAKMTARATAHGAPAITEHMRLLQYAFTIGVEFFLLFLVWIGLRMRGTKIRELIGGKWPTPESFLLDLAIAIGFWLVALAVLAGLGWALRLAQQAGAAKKLADALGPHSWPGLGLFVLLSCVAGFVEEIIFRGYLQQQIGAWTGNIYWGLALSAIVFGASHGYEGTRRMILIAVYGAMFGSLALWRKSLRPGMMAHAWHDSLAGAILFLAARKGFFSMR